MREVSTREGELLAGKYQLEKRLAAGGMGEVYRATNTAIGRTVAIKLLLAEHARNDTLVARFMTEARAANLVRHPNVVDVLDVGKADDGTPFIVQELLEGHDLGQHIVEFGGRLPATAVIELMAPIVEAIGVAHAAGVVHRDLKPENVFLARVGNALVPKLLDFGISQVISAEPSVRLTATGTAMGTPTYMSPEQVTSSKLVDARTDVWALGVILYELLAGELPFKGETPGAMFVKIATEEATPLDQLAPHVPAALVKIVGRCMQKKREMRYATANELARDMKAVLEGRLPEPSKSGPLAGLPAIAAQHVHSREAAMETASALRVELPTDPFAGLEVRSPPAVPSPRRSGADDIAIASSPLGVGEPSGGHVELDAGDDVSAASGLQTVSYPPDAPPTTPRAAQPGPARPRPPRPSRENEPATAFDAREILNAVSLGVIVFGLGGLLTWLDPVPGGWSVQAWLGGADRATTIVVGVSLLLGAFAAGAAGTRHAPTSWGHVVAAMGLLAVSALLGLSTFAGDTAGAIVPQVMPFASALVPLGLAVWGLGKAWGEFRSLAVRRKAVGFILALVVAVGFSAAIQLVRGAS